MTTQPTQSPALDTLVNDAVQPITGAVNSFVFHAISSMALTSR